ncbi:flagellar biosynthetic protein FliO [Aurantimonas sp. Leaf443]|uniref:flagellar biosynthetic protein FliO n=1 Tax=Aurantimonas sp. Leaf443 TaxID=1736378 RepID=UPI00138F68B4|nr:flagellar biosynthetic protein FliO [Aurantimonas sp. Leaf443]
MTGESMAPILWVAIVMVAVCALAIVVILLARKAFGTGGASLRSRAPRLAILDVLSVDQRRKLVLVRRDEVEHLVLIGGQNDLVVEGTIQRQPLAARGRPEPASLERVDAAEPRLASAQPRQRPRPRVEGPAPVPSLDRPPLPLPVQRPRTAQPVARGAMPQARDAQPARLDTPAAPTVPVAVTAAPLVAAAPLTPRLPTPGADHPADRDGAPTPAAKAPPIERETSRVEPVLARDEAPSLEASKPETPNIEAPRAETPVARAAPVQTPAAAETVAPVPALRPKPALEAPRPADLRPTPAAADYPSLPRTAKERTAGERIAETRPAAPPLASSPMPRATPVEARPLPPMAATPQPVAPPPPADAPSEPHPHDGEEDRAALRARMNQDPAGAGSVADLTAPTISIEKREPTPSTEGERRPLSVTSFASAIQNRKGPSEMPSPPAPETGGPKEKPGADEPSLEDFLSAELDSDFGNDSFFDGDVTPAAPAAAKAPAPVPTLPSEPQGVAASVLAALAARNRPAEDAATAPEIAPEPKSSSVAPPVRAPTDAPTLSQPASPRPAAAPHVPGPGIGAPAAAPARGAMPAAPAPVVEPRRETSVPPAERIAPSFGTVSAERSAPVSEAGERKPLPAGPSDTPTSAAERTAPTIAPASPPPPPRPAVDAEPPQPRKLTLEEEMERLLGDFTFDHMIDPPRR